MRADPSSQLHAADRRAEGGQAMRRETALFILEFSARILRRKKLAGLCMFKVNMFGAVMLTMFLTNDD